MARPTATPDQFADFLINDYWENKNWHAFKWEGPEVTFAISDGFSAGNADGIRTAFRLWEQVIDLEFREVEVGADIKIEEGSDRGAWSLTWSLSNGLAYDSTISIDTDVAMWSDLERPGRVGSKTVLHEIGHSLGLGHPGHYNGYASFESDALWANDTRQYSLMSYFGAHHSGADHNSQQPWTPMLFDIYAAQQIYGPNMTTRTGDTVYGFNTNTDLVQFDFSIPAGSWAPREPVITIWDAGGLDTLDLSGFPQAQRVSLQDGTFSDVGGMADNLSIAFGATIENAIGGSGDDTILGNAAANGLSGGAGNDLIVGGPGDDTLDGGAGFDMLQYDAVLANYELTLSGLNELIVNGANSGTGDGVDLVRNVETIAFAGFEYPFAELEAMLQETNAPPLAADDSATIFANTRSAIDVLRNDSDPDGLLKAASPVIATSPAHGKATVNPDGTIYYTPDTGFFGTDAFTYTISDDQGLSSGIATATVSVLPSPALGSILWLDEAGSVTAWPSNGSDGVQFGRPAAGFDLEMAIDLDGNGRSDLLWSTSSGGLLAWYVDSQGDAIAETRWIGRPDGDQILDQIVDLGSNPGCDLIWTEADGSRFAWTFASTARGDNIWLGRPPATQLLVSVVDIDQRGTADLLWEQDDGFFAWQLDGHARLGNIWYGRPPGDPDLVGLYDVDGTGSLDFLWQDAAGNLFAWRLAGEERLPNAWYGKPHGFSLSQVTDVDGDSDVDFLWENEGGQYLAWLLEDGVRESNRWIGRPAEPAVLAATADIDGNGHGDLLWERANADVEVWLYGEDSIIGITDIPAPDHAAALLGVVDFA